MTAQQEERLKYPNTSVFYQTPEEARVALSHQISRTSWSCHSRGKSADAQKKRYVICNFPGCQCALNLTMTSKGWHFTSLCCTKRYKPFHSEICRKSRHGSIAAWLSMKPQLERVIQSYCKSSTRTSIIFREISTQYPIDTSEQFVKQELEKAIRRARRVIAKGRRDPPMLGVSVEGVTVSPPGAPPPGSITPTPASSNTTGVVPPGAPPPGAAGGHVSHSHHVVPHSMKEEAMRMKPGPALSMQVPTSMKHHTGPIPVRVGGPAHIPSPGVLDDGSGMPK
eukprot:gnl/Dysnectes_brevis/1455_a1646_1594.p1 GENE.gnl/Dysnectes_brevis/1455_a1646_1594~~gnl/Dysnectes_brevis/1455_a1646_1594.p1  ORF type:complete len:281 (-),score=59.43 gnl/Dysnectes_brevis/1455_a1646_1594:55-897(-)